MNSLDFNRGYTTLIGSAIDFIADLYDLSIDEVKRAMDREEYWCIWNTNFKGRLEEIWTNTSEKLKDISEGMVRLK